jgi:hypothetical protein
MLFPVSVSTCRLGLGAAEQAVVEYESVCDERVTTHTAAVQREGAMLVPPQDPGGVKLSSFAGVSTRVAAWFSISGSGALVSTRTGLVALWPPAAEIDATPADTAAATLSIATGSTTRRQPVNAQGPGNLIAHSSSERATAPARLRMRLGRGDGHASPA